MSRVSGIGRLPQVPQETRVLPTLIFPLSTLSPLILNNKTLFIDVRLRTHRITRTTEQFYAHFSPEFAIERARPVLEDRFEKPDGSPDGSQTGDTDPEGDPSEKPPSERTSNLFIFKQLKK